MSHWNLPAGLQAGEKEKAMSSTSADFGTGWWSQNLSEVDKEVARLAAICNVRLLDPGVIARVLGNDASVCGASNPLAFEKLRAVLMMHYVVRGRAAESIGEGQAQILVNRIVEDLKEKFGDRLGTPPAG